MHKEEALLLYGSTDFGAPQFSADILWRTKFRVPDPVFFIECAGRGVLFVSSLEYGRAKKEAQIDEVVLLVGDASAMDQVISFLAHAGISRCTISAEFPYAFAKKCEGTCALEVRHGSLYPERMKKSAFEIEEIARAQAAAARAILGAREFLRGCRIKDGVVVSGDDVLTSEMLKVDINKDLYAHGYLGVGTIVASGFQAADPHAEGTGPIMAHAPIVLDVFPVSLTTHYYGDMTRTLFKGAPSKEFERMYETVRNAQEEGVVAARAGADASVIYLKVVERLVGAGYPTETSSDTAEGFIHGLGHGVGLEVHEEPRVGKRLAILEKGNVITIEPGLYYSKSRPGIPVGGIRIEDIVVVEEGGSRVLADLPKDIGWAVIE